MDDAIDITDVLCAIASQLQGIRSELRAARLEQRAMIGKSRDGDTDELKQVLTDADDVAHLFGPDEPEAPARVLS